MSVTVETVAPRQLKLTILVTQDQRARARHDVAQAIAKRERIKGYRPGHVPEARAVALVGEEAFDAAVIEHVAPKAFQAAIVEAGIEPGAPARVGVATREPLVLEALVPLEPEVELGDYRALRVDLPEAQPVTEGDVDALLDRLREDLAILTPHDGPAEAGDIAEVRLVGMLDGESAFDEVYRYPLDVARLPERSVPPEAVAEVVGASVGETRRFSARYSEFWPDKRLQGRTVALEATLRSLARRQLPELDDAFAAQVLDGATLETLRERVRERLEADAERAMEDARADAAVQALVDQTRLEIAPLMLEIEMERTVDTLRQSIEREGQSWASWLELQKENEEQLLQEIEQITRRRLERALVLQRFAEAEEIRLPREVFDELVDRTAQTVRARSGARRKRIDEGQRQQIGSTLLTAMVLRRLIDLVGGTAAEPAAAAEPAEG